MLISARLVLADELLEQVLAVVHEVASQSLLELVPLKAHFLLVLAHKCLVELPVKLKELLLVVVGELLHIDGVHSACLKRNALQVPVVGVLDAHDSHGSVSSRVKVPFVHRVVVLSLREVLVV